MNQLRHSLSFRLALTYAVLFCLSVALLMAAAYWLRVVLPMDRSREVVDREARHYAELYRSQGPEATKVALERRAKVAGAFKPFHALIAPDGTVVTANYPSWPPDPTGDTTVIEADAFVDGFEVDHDALTRDQVLASGARLLIGRDVEEITGEEALLRTAALWILSGTLILGLSGGWLMSHAIGSRIESVSRAARQVMEGDLTGRVPVSGADDDFDRLCETLNLMLSRIETLFQSVRAVSDNAAHELRTPLARLVGRLEALDSQVGDNLPMRLAVDAAIVDATRLQQIFAALLRISRLGGGRHSLQLQRTDVVQLLEDVVEFYHPEAERLGVALVLHARRPLVADLDLDLVFQALCNLLDNALKHGAGGSTVEISGARCVTGLVLSVSDDGPGLAPDEIGRVTEQFYRGRESAAISGDGLGLSMVAAIANAHDAAIEITPLAPGLRVSVVFEERRPDNV